VKLETCGNNSRSKVIHFTGYPFITI